MDHFVPVGRGRAEHELELGIDDLRGLHDELLAARRSGTVRVVANDPIWNALRLAESMPPGSDFGWAEFAPVGCSAGTGSCVVSADGHVYPCTFLPMSLGDVRTESLEDILAGSDVVAALSDRDRLEGDCGDCRLRLICGGCRDGLLPARVAAY